MSDFGLGIRGGWYYMYRLYRYANAKFEPVEIPGGRFSLSSQLSVNCENC